MAQRQLSPAGPRLQSRVRSQLHFTGRQETQTNNDKLLIFKPEALMPRRVPI